MTYINLVGKLKIYRSSHSFIIIMFLFLELLSVQALAAKGKALMKFRQDVGTNVWDPLTDLRFRLPTTFPEFADEENQGSSPKSLCNGSKLSPDFLKIAGCLKEIYLPNKKFVDELMKKAKKPGTAGDCARYIGNASVKSHLVKKYPAGCTGPEKSKDILNRESQFIDLAPYLENVFPRKLIGASGHSDEVISASLMLPPGTLLSFRGDNPGNCIGRGYFSGKNRNGLGHFCGTTESQKFCHSMCERCPSPEGRYLDKMLVKVKEEYLQLFADQPKLGLKEICQEVYHRKNGSGAQLNLFPNQENSEGDANGTR